MLTTYFCQEKKMLFAKYSENFLDLISIMVLYDRMSRINLYRQISNRIGVRYEDVREVLEATKDEIMEHVGRGHRVVFRGLGVFERVYRRPRRVNNVYAGKEMWWEGGWRAKFRFSSDVHAKINGLPTQNDKLLAKKEKGDAQETA